MFSSISPTGSLLSPPISLDALVLSRGRGRERPRRPRRLGYHRFAPNHPLTRFGVSLFFTHRS